MHRKSRSRSSGRRQSGLWSVPYLKVISCRSHSPPLSQVGQSSGWLISKNSTMPFLALITLGVLVHTTIPGVAGVLQAIINFCTFSTSTRQTLQPPKIFSFSCQQKVGISIPAFFAACRMVFPSSTSTGLLSMSGKRGRNREKTNRRPRGRAQDPL